MDITYQVKITRFLKRKKILDSNMSKAYALIFSNYCNKIMQNRVKEHSNFESKIQDNSITVLKAIKTLMHDSVRAKCPYTSLTEVISRTLNIK